MLVLLKFPAGSEDEIGVSEEEVQTDVMPRYGEVVRFRENRYTVQAVVYDIDGKARPQVYLEQA